MLVILEGPDGAGKTTLAEMLLKHNKGSYVHYGPMLELDDRQLAQKYALPILQHINNGCQDLLIMDRAWPSEFIYGNVVEGRRNRINAARHAMLIRLAYSCPLVMVWMLPEYQVCLKNYKGRVKDEYIKKEKIFQEVYAGYDVLVNSVFGSTKLTAAENMLLIDKLPDCEVASTILDTMHLTYLTNRTKPESLSGIGNWCAGNIIIVGDVTNGPRDLPFVDLVKDSGCSAWLANQLSCAQITEGCLYWVNTKQPSGRWNNPEDLLKMDPEYIVCLGRNACDWVTDSIKFDRIRCFDHPSYHKRFKFNEPYPLINFLKEVIYDVQ